MAGVLMHQYSIFNPAQSRPEPAQSIDALAQTLAEYLPNDQVQQIKRAYFYAEQAHEAKSAYASPT